MWAVWLVAGVVNALLSHTPELPPWGDAALGFVYGAGTVLAAWRAREES